MKKTLFWLFVVVVIFCAGYFGFNRYQEYVYINSVSDRVRLLTVLSEDVLEGKLDDVILSESYVQSIDELLLKIDDTKLMVKLKKKKNEDFSNKVIGYLDVLRFTLLNLKLCALNSKMAVIVSGMARINGDPISAIQIFVKTVDSRREVVKSIKSTAIFLDLLSSHRLAVLKYFDSDVVISASVIEALKKDLEVNLTAWS